MSLQRITFHVTDRCQLNCDHCLRDPGGKPVDMPLSFIEKVVDQATALYGTKHVGMTGGEPTLHPEFYQIVDAIVDRGLTWHMVSNGERFDQVVQRLAERPERLAGLTIANFSLDGANEETHDGIREKGNFRSMMMAAAICKARDIKFLFQITLNRRNVEEIEEIALLASQLGADRLAYNFMQPTGTFLDDDLSLPAADWKRALDRINRARDTFKIEMYHSETGPSEGPFVMCEMWRHGHLHVDYKGQLNLCCQHAGVPSEGPVSDVAGDLNEMPLAEAHGRYTEIVNWAVKSRLEAIQKDDISEWDKDFSCNWCLKQFGKPHWTEQGASGPDAERPRWRGGWTPGYKDSHRDADPSLVQIRLNPDRTQ